MTRFYEFNTAEGAESKHVMINVGEVSSIEKYRTSSVIIMQSGKQYSLSVADANDLMTLARELGGPNGG